MEKAKREERQIKEDPPENEARIRSIVNTAVDAIFTINERGIIDTVNTAAERIFGYTRVELIGKSITILMSEPYKSEHDQYMQNYIRTGKAKIIGVGREVIARRKDGTIFPIDLAVSEFFLGEQRFFTGIIRDITQRKKAEERLAAEHAVARAIAESTSLREATLKILQAICENLGWDIGEFLVVNKTENMLHCVEFWNSPSNPIPEFERVTRQIGFAPSVGLPGRIWAENRLVWIADVTKDGNFPRKDAAAREGIRSGVGFPIRLGAEIYGVMDFFSAVMHPPDDQLHQMFDAIGSQIGQYMERTRVEEELRKSERNYREIFDAANDAIFVHDPETGDILDVNRKMCEMYGCSLEEARRLSVEDLSSGEVPYTRVYALERIRKAAAGQPQLFEWHARSRDGRLFWVEVNLRLAPIGGKDRLLAVVRDITERKQMEEAKLQLEEQLRQRSQQLKLFEEKLRDTEKLTIIGTLATEIAHEIGTPLNIMTGRLEMLSEKTKSHDSINKDIAIINKQIDRITKIIRDVLDLSRKRKGELTTVDPHQLIHGLLEFLRIPMDKARIQVELSLCSEKVRIHGDEDHLQQVFINLLMNSIQAMHGPGTLSIRTALRKKENRPFLEIEIEDTGEGIPPENMEKIFDPFFSTKKDRGGTGLGLSIVYQIIQGHGGQISVESEIQQGSTFRIWLPVARP